MTNEPTKVSAQKMPVLFIGHGSPMNAIEKNEFSQGWRDMADILPRPKTILCISAHWETWGTLITAMEHPRTIHDFGGFPKKLFETIYPATGNPTLASEIQHELQSIQIGLDQDWGLDHGCWSVLNQMYPAADIPVLQLSLDYTKTPQQHYELGRALEFLRYREVLILGSGNIVHNLRRVVFPGIPGDFNQPFALDWAREADQMIKKLIADGNHQALIDYPTLGPAMQLAVPTPEHYLPFLYILALKGADETISYFNDKPIAGSLTMTSLLIQ